MVQKLLFSIALALLVSFTSHSENAHKEDALKVVHAAAAATPTPAENPAPLPMEAQDLTPVVTAEEPHIVYAVYSPEIAGFMAWYLMQLPPEYDVDSLMVLMTEHHIAFNTDVADFNIEGGVAFAVIPDSMGAYRPVVIMDLAFIEQSDVPDGDVVMLMTYVLTLFRQYAEGRMPPEAFALVPPASALTPAEALRLFESQAEAHAEAARVANAYGYAPQYGPEAVYTLEGLVAMRTVLAEDLALMPDLAPHADLLIRQAQNHPDSAAATPAKK